MPSVYAAKKARPAPSKACASGKAVKLARGGLLEVHASPTALHSGRAQSAPENVSTVQHDLPPVEKYAICTDACHRLWQRSLTGSMPATKNAYAGLLKTVPPRLQLPMEALLRSSPGTEGVIFLGFSSCGGFLYSYSFDAALQFELQVWKVTVAGATYQINPNAGAARDGMYNVRMPCPPLSLWAACPLFPGADWAAISGAGLLLDGTAVRVALWESSDRACLVAVGSLHERGLRVHQPYQVTVLPNPCVMGSSVSNIIDGGAAGHDDAACLGPGAGLAAGDTRPPLMPLVHTAPSQSHTNPASDDTGMMHASSCTAMHFSVPVAPPFPRPTVLGFAPIQMGHVEGQEAMDEDGEDTEHGDDDEDDEMFDVGASSTSTAARASSSPPQCTMALAHGCPRAYRLVLSTGDGQTCVTFGVRGVGQGPGGSYRSAVEGHPQASACGDQATSTCPSPCPVCGPAPAPDTPWYTSGGSVGTSAPLSPSHGPSQPDTSSSSSTVGNGQGIAPAGIVQGLRYTLPDRSVVKHVARFYMPGTDQVDGSGRRDADDADSEDAEDEDDNSPGAAPVFTDGRTAHDRWTRTAPADAHGSVTAASATRVCSNARDPRAYLGTVVLLSQARVDAETLLARALRNKGLPHSSTRNYDARLVTILDGHTAAAREAAAPHDAALHDVFSFGGTTAGTPSPVTGSSTNGGVASEQCSKAVTEPEAMLLCCVVDYEDHPVGQGLGQGLMGLRGQAGHTASSTAANSGLARAGRPTAVEQKGGAAGKGAGRHADHEDVLASAMGRPEVVPSEGTASADATGATAAAKPSKALRTFGGRGTKASNGGRPTSAGSGRSGLSGVSVDPSHGFEAGLGLELPAVLPAKRDRDSGQRLSGPSRLSQGSRRSAGSACTGASDSVADTSGSSWDDVVADAGTQADQEQVEADFKGPFEHRDQDGGDVRVTHAPTGKSKAVHKDTRASKGSLPAAVAPDPWDEVGADDDAGQSQGPAQANQQAPKEAPSRPAPQAPHEHNSDPSDPWDDLFEEEDGLSSKVRQVYSAGAAGLEAREGQAADSQAQQMQDRPATKLSSKPAEPSAWDEVVEDSTTVTGSSTRGHEDSSTVTGATGDGVSAYSNSTGLGSRDTSREGSPEHAPQVDHRDGTAASHGSQDGGSGSSSGSASIPSSTSLGSSSAVSVPDSLIDDQEYSGPLGRKGCGQGQGTAGVRHNGPGTVSGRPRGPAQTVMVAAHGPVVRDRLVISVRLSSGAAVVLAHTRLPPAMQPAFDRTGPNGRSLSSLTSQAVNGLRAAFPSPPGHTPRELTNDAVLVGRSLTRLLSPAMPLAIVL